MSHYHDRKVLKIICVGTICVVNTWITELFNLNFHFKLCHATASYNFK